ncbi:hypothetical protein C8R47DRAFT_938158, partial [Mycena vitilis]
MQNLSNELSLILQIFPHLPLKSLVAAQGVNTLWGTLLPLSNLNSVRREFLEFYLHLIGHPIFMHGRPWLVQNLHSFDRQAYLDALLTQHHYLPEHFCLWILEWPAQAAIACMWLGLPPEYHYKGDDFEIRRGYNFFGRIPPVVHTVRYKDIGLPALLVWETYDYKLWILLVEHE